MAKRKTSHYIDNAKFLEALKDYRAARLATLENGTDAPQIPEYVGECFLKIATHLSFKSNFMGYTFRDDMISDGIENCLVYIDNFDPDKSSNPFGYFTQIIFFAFIRRIQKEKKHTYTKYKLIEQALIDGTTSLDPTHASAHTDGHSTGRSMLQFDNVKDFISRFDDYTDKRRERRRQSKKVL